ncbi:MAG: hypothetical protein DHS20C18_12850 [Saprospiraceae bacterium]|nr:MAG: hypothetical protein DHS20C18_12850 [Saprospiraceae bacterium]
MIKERSRLFHTYLTPILYKRTISVLFSFLLVLWLPRIVHSQTSQVDSLWDAYQTQSDINQKSLILAKIGFSLRTVNIDSAFEVLEKGLGFARETDFLFGEAECILNLGSVYLIQSDFDKAQQAYQRALGIYESIDNINGVAKSMNNLGLIYYQRGDYSKAIDYFEQSLGNYKELKDRSKISGCLHNIALVFTAQGNYSKALDSYLKSLKIVEELNSKQGIAYTCIALGQLFQTVEDDEQAITYYERGLKLSEELKDKPGIITCLYNIGTYKSKHQEFYTALDFFQKSLKIALELSSEQYASVCLRAIGETNKELKRYPEAEDFFTQSLEMQMQMVDEPEMSETYLQFGELYIEMGKRGKGIEFINNAIEMARKYGNQGDLLLATESLAKIYEEIGKLDKALILYTESEVLRDSLFGMKASSEIAKIQLKYNSEIHEKDFQLSLMEKDNIYQEIKYLNQQRTIKSVGVALFIIIGLSIALWYVNAGRKKANIALEENNVELDKATKSLEYTNTELLKANHQLKVANSSLDQFAFAASNDLMESLGAVNKNSQLLKIGMETDQPDEMINYYLNIIARNGRQMYQTLDDLLNYVNLRVNPVAKTEVSLLEIVELIESGLEQEIESSSGQIIYAELPNLQAQPHLIRQLFYQLMKNAVQFKSHDELLLVEIGAEEKGEDFIFYIKDNGIGIPGEFLGTIFEPFTRVATEQQIGSGLGLALCKKIVKLYRGKIWIESTPGAGTSVYFTLPDCNPSFAARTENILAGSN